MNIIRTLVGPESKLNPDLPYTYEARIDPMDGIGEKDDLLYYYSDTLCGLVHFLDEKGIAPKDVELVAVFKDKEINIDPKPMTKDKRWLRRPALCRSLEDHYQASQLKQYIGHEMHSECEYTDRDQTVI
jgi:hypothetical protein